MKHDKLSSLLAKVISDPTKIQVKLKAEFVDVAYPPIFQSGGDYNFKFSASSNSKPMHYGVIVCQAGAK